MGEQIWRTKVYSEPMLRFIRGRTSNRKCRLLACAAARLVWDKMPDERSRRAVEVAELFADGLSGDADRRAALAAALQAVPPVSPPDASRRCVAAIAACHTLWRTVDQMLEFAEPEQPIPQRAEGLALRVAMWMLQARKSPVRYPSPAAWCALVREIFGNPFHPVVFDPRWQTSDVVGLARAIYDDRAFERMPILADALMDAGCEDEQVIGHCRSERPHVRGCWVVDLALGKK